DREANRRAAGGARRRAGVRGERPGRRHSVPPRRAHRRRAVRLPLGRGAQAGAARSRGGVVTVAARRIARGAGPAPAVPGRTSARDGPRLGADLDAHACATVPSLLAPDECRALVEAYGVETRFRRRIVMAQHGFGQGEYKYFAYPLPDVIAELR